MVDRLYSQSSLASSASEALNYAWNDPEQRFEWLNIQTRRRAFRNLATMPGELYSWYLTSGAKGGKPLFPDLSQNYSNPGKFIDSNLFTGLLFKNALDIGAKFGLSTFVKTATIGYRRNEKYKRMIAASDELLALAHTAPVVDELAAKTIHEIVRTRQTPLEQLALHSQQANDVMTKFAKGTLPITAGNLHLLQQSLRSMAIISDERAGLAPASIDAPTPQSPSASLRQVIKTNRLDSAYEAALYLTTLSGLVTDGAFDIAMEMYEHKDEYFLTVDESLRAARSVESALNHHKLQLNRTADGKPILAGYPVDIMLQQTDQGLAPAPAATIIAVANEVKQSLRFLKFKIERMLVYADKHFADVDHQLTHGRMQVVQRDEANHAAKEWGVSHMRSQTAATTLNIKPEGYYRASELGVDHIVREQARHEMWKLYGRSLPTYLYQAPINLVERLLLPDKKSGKWKFNPAVIRSELLAAGWMAAYNPAAESFAGVGMYEAVRLKRAQAVNQSRHMDNFLAAAVKTTQAADEEFAGALQKLKTSDQLMAIHERYQGVLAKPAEERNTEDNKQVANYFNELADETAKLAQPTYALLTPDGEGFSGFKQHIQTVLMEGPKRPTDALAVFSLIRFIQTIANEQILSMEFVSPDDVIADRAALNRITKHMMKRLSQHGFVINGGQLKINGALTRIDCPGVEIGALVKRTGNSTFTQISGDELVKFANELTDFIRSKDGVDIVKLFEITTGRMSNQYMARLEQDMLGSATLPSLSDDAKTVTHDTEHDTEPTQQAALSATLKHRPKQRHYWQDLKAHISRPETKDEMHKLRDRTMFIAMFGIPVKMIANTLRGDFGNIKGMFGKWSLASTGFHAVASTLAASYGAVSLRETTSLKGYWLKEDAVDASHALQGAIGAMGVLRPDIKRHFATKTGINPLLGNRRVEYGLHRLASAIDPEQTDPDAKREASSFVHKSGIELVDHTISALSGSAHLNTSEHSIELLEKPATNNEQAIQLLAVVDAIVRTQSESVNALRYDKGKAQQVMDDKGLQKLVDHINDRAFTEGLLASTNVEGLPLLVDAQGNPANEGLLVAFANDVAAKTKDVLKSHRKTASDFAQIVLNEKLRTAEQEAVLNAF